MSKSSLLASSPSSSSSSTITYKIFSNQSSAVDERIPDDLLSKCSKLFSNYYGVWNKFDSNESHLQGLKSGMKVKMNVARMKKELLFDEYCGIATAWKGEDLVGHSFFTSFQYGDKKIRWITQLVVHSEYRRKGIAVELLVNCCRDKYHLYGIGLVSSHPAAVRALEWASSTQCTLHFAREHAQNILNHISVPYLQSVKGKLTINDSMCVIDTNFYVDHKEVLPILAKFQTLNQWKIGDHLPDGSEFFAFCPFKPPSPP